MKLTHPKILDHHADFNLRATKAKVLLDNLVKRNKPAGLFTQIRLKHALRRAQNNEDDFIRTHEVLKKFGQAPKYIINDIRAKQAHLMDLVKELETDTKGSSDHKIARKSLLPNGFSNDVFRRITRSGKRRLRII